MTRADLHIHTYYSDGAQSPADVIAAARRRGVGLISVTDHDTARASAEVRELAQKAGIIAVDGEEISAYDGAVKIHLLCYGADFSRREFTEFNRKLKENSEERALDILKKLAAVGVNISYGDVLRERKSDKVPVHAMHIAVAGARKFYARSPYDFYAQYLNAGTAGFSCKGRPTPEETCRVIKQCGGICSLAHPGRISLGKEELISLVERLVPCGLGGIEAVYSGHTAKETQYYKELAERYDLYVTGGSDTHRDGGNREVGIPEFYPDGGLMSALGII